MTTDQMKDTIGQLQQAMTGSVTAATNVPAVSTTSQVRPGCGCYGCQQAKGCDR